MLIWQIKSHQHWIGMIVIGVFFTIGGVATLVAAFLVDSLVDRGALLVSGVLVTAAGIIPLIFSRRARRESGAKVDEDLVLAAPQRGPKRALGTEPWTLEQVAGDLAKRLEGTPYVVQYNDRMIQVTWDLGDQSWWVLAQKNGIRRVFETRLVKAKNDKLSRTDIWHDLDWQAGVPHLRARAESGAGRSWRYERRIEFGTDGDGLTKKVDYTLNTKDLNEPLAKVLRRGGWGEAGLGAEALGALMVGGIGASAIVIVPLALLIKHLVEG